jgi:antitoxin (DNA-binding transcriptional repressor) of toxin-antitoxin stability system
MGVSVVTLSVTEFKAKCLALFDQLESRKVDKVIVTRRGKAVAELAPPAAALPPLHGAHRGSVVVPDGVDLTAPTFADDEFDAERGILHR